MSAARADGIVARPDRGVVAVGGPEAAEFLHGVVTGTVKGLAAGEARFSALLTPQGKVLFDFFLVATGDGFLLVAERARIGELVKRLGFYRLRAKVTIADVSAEWDVHTVLGGEGPAIEGAIDFADPRLAALGRHVVVPAGSAVACAATLDDWAARRIGVGVPESGVDFPLGDVFPHDLDMDDLGGVDFKKGCFVGQEVVSRMKHRGTARRRVIVAQRLDAAAWPAAGAEILAGDKALGSLGGAAGDTALALVRLDRAKEAIDAGRAITVGGVPIALSLPAFARFGWPEGAASD